eukprot:350959-Chlamydomonas_euryale.AAC.3
MEVWRIGVASRAPPSGPDTPGRQTCVASCTTRHSGARPMGLPASRRPCPCSAARHSRLRLRRGRGPPCPWWTRSRPVLRPLP